MALPAIEPGMASGKLIAGKRVVKRAFAVFKIDQGEVSAVVLDMTHLAIPVIRRCVQTLTGADALRDGCVTDKALFGEIAAVR